MNLKRVTPHLACTRCLPVVLLLLACTASNGYECSIRLPEAGDLPDTMRAPVGFTWVGTSALAAQVPSDGHWTAMGPKRDYRDKWWWWREGYTAQDEPRPNIKVTAVRLDGPAPVFKEPFVTSAVGPGWDRMLVMMEFPTAGCWDVLVDYDGHELRFVFRVGGESN